MARIIENLDGRRMIRLTAEDVLMVVSLYQQQVYELTSRDFETVRSHLAGQDIYLPEEV